MKGKKNMNLKIIIIIVEIKPLNIGNRIFESLKHSKLIIRNN